jgi:predicted ATPase/DNA-binding SARP family transcriptional activator/tetratricopeptide (TPR) repeat protein
VRIGVLGPLEVRTEAGEPVEVAGARLRALLVRLALAPGRVVGSGQLIDAVWGSEPPAGAANALQALVSRLRRAVPELVLESHPAGYRLGLEPSSVDAVAFERLLAQGREAEAEALRLWRGPALAEFDFARAAAARLTELYLSTVERNATLPELEALAVEHPTRERLAALLMRALNEAGRPADALAVFERTRSAIADGLGADPSPELAALHLELLRGGGAPARERRSNLRASLTTFVGRDADVARIEGLLADARLLTLVGPGGAGKTRLAMECAAALADRFPDGVWLVELAGVRDPGELASTVLSALGLREHALLSTNARVFGATEDPAERLVRALRDKRLLVVLDNCEHLVGAAAVLAEDVLGQCPGVRVLATSREPLALTGETLWTVGPLELPPPGADEATALRSAAVRLFLERATAVRPDYRLELGPVVDLCRALDGLPLAIELAAARMRTMTAAQVAERLDDRFRLLVAGSRTALPRHQTLRAVVDWSWELLDSDERALWRRLSVFAAGATLDAAETVSRRGPSTRDIAYSLAEKSLLLVLPEVGSEVGAEPRFGQLETIRAYGLERLAEAGEAAEVRDRFVGHFVDLVELAEPRLRGRDQVGWLDRLRGDHDNLHHALRTAISTVDTRAALRLVAGLGWYWWLAGYRREAADLAEEALGLPGLEADPERAQAQAVASLSVIDGNRSFDAVREWVGEAVRLASLVDSSTPAMRVMKSLYAMIATPDPAEQIPAVSELVDDEDPWTRATGYLLRAHVRLNHGTDEQRALARLDMLSARDNFGEIGERWGLSSSVWTLAEQAGRDGDRAEARQRWCDAIGYLEELRAREDLPQIRARFAHELWLQGDFDEATRVLDLAIREAERAGANEALGQALIERADQLRHCGRLVEARRELDRADALLATMHPSGQLRAIARTSAAHLAAAEGDLAAARALHEEALGLAAPSMDAPVLGQTVVGAAGLAVAEGRMADAASLLGAAAGIRGGDDQSIPERSTVEEAARAALGAEGFAEAYARGRAAPDLDRIHTWAAGMAAGTADAREPSASLSAKPGERLDGRGGD